MIIAIDGPSASGKGTLAIKLAKHFNITHLDTGLLYRALGLKILNTKTDESDIEAICTLAKNLTPDDFKSEKLKTEEIGHIASKISTIQKVRDILLDLQRKIAYNKKGAVLDGRDIGTVVCPDAGYKFFLDATIEERAKRRYKELKEKNMDVVYEDILQKLKVRDKRDSERANSPLKKADDAIEVDTTNMTRQEVFDYVLSFIK